MPAPPAAMAAWSRPGSPPRPGCSSARSAPSAARSLMRLSREAMGLMRARIERHAIPCDPVSGVVIASWFDDGERACGPRSPSYNQRFGMRLEFWSRDAAAAQTIPSPRYWDGMFDPEGFHLDPLALCRGYAARRRGAGRATFENSPATGLRRASRRLAGDDARRARSRPSGWSCARAPTRRGWCPHWRARPCRCSPTSSSPHRSPAAMPGDPRTLCRLRQPLRHRLLPPAAGRPAALGRSDQHAASSRAIWLA